MPISLHFASCLNLRLPAAVRYALIVLFAASAFSVIAVPCSAQQADLPTLFARAADNFEPISGEQISAARRELTESMNAVERFIRPSTKNGQGWMRYLRWEKLEQAVSAEGPLDSAALAATYRQLNRDENGLEKPQFRRLSAALLRYNQLQQLAGQSDQAQYYRSQLDRLASQLETQRREPSPNNAFEIGSRLGFVAGVGQAPDLVRAIRKEFAQPNAFFEVSTALIAAGVDPIDRRECIDDCILGTTIRSDAHSRGTVGVSTIPSDDKAILEFISDGHTRSTNRGTNGPAVIRSTSDTNFSATKRVELDDRAFVGRPSRARASTDTHLQSVSKQGGGLGSRLVSNIGWSRAKENERRAEAIASDHAEDRIERRFNDELNDELREARRRYVDEYRRPLERRGELPEHIRFHSGDSSLGVEVAQVNRDQLGASGAPPEAPADHDMTMRLHETAVNNYSASLLGGATASESEPGQDLKFDVKLPSWMKEAWQNRETSGEESAQDEPFKPYSITFRDGRPVTVNFVDGEIKITIHIARLKSGKDTFRNWDVTGTYTRELADGGILLRRQGDLVMMPVGEITNRRIAERQNLEQELNERSEKGRGFPKEIKFDALEPDGNLADSGPLDFNAFETGGGWLTVAWDRRQKSRQ